MAKEKTVSINFTVFNDEFRESLKEMNNDLKGFSSEIKLNDAQLKSSSKTTENYEDKIKNLEGAYDVISRKVVATEQQLEKAKSVFGENSKEVQRLTQELNKQKTEQQNYQSKLDETSKELKKFKSDTNVVTNTLSTFGDTMKAIWTSKALDKGLSMISNTFSGIKSSIQNWMSMSQEGVESEATLAQVMRNTIGASDEEIKSINDLAEAQEAIGVVSRETTLAGAQELGTYVTKTSTLKQLLPVLDNMVAQQYGVNASEESAVTISTMLGKVMNGQVSALSRYGYSFTDAQAKILKFGTEEERAAVLADVVNESVGGVNEALSETDAAKMTKAKKEIEDMQKAAGLLFTNFRQDVVADLLPSIKTISSAVQGMFSGDMGIKDGLKQVASGVKNAIGQISNIFQEMDITSLVSDISTEILTFFGEIGPSILELFGQISTELLNCLPIILDVGLQLVLELIKGMAEGLPTAIPQIVDFLINICDVLLDNIDLVVDVGLEILSGLVDGILNALPILVEKLPVIIDKFISVISENLPKIVETGILLLIKLGDGLIQAIPKLLEKLPDIIYSICHGLGTLSRKLFEVGGNLLGNIKDGLVDGMSGMFDVGKNIVEGLWNGINNAKDWVINQVKGFGSSILDGIKGIFGIHSPSTVFRDEVGKNLALGIGEGFTDEMKTVNKEITDSLNYQGVSFDINESVNSSLGSNAPYVQLVIENAVIREEEDIDRLADKISEKLGERL